MGAEEVMAMDKFIALPQVRQDHIAAAAMKVFGAVGYKKAYVSDIAAAAGISKALIFHYFGNKKTLYFYLIEYTGKIMMAEVWENRETANADFFEKVVDATKKKLAIMNRYPAMTGFLASIFYENDPEVAEQIKTLFSQGGEIRHQITIEGSDKRKFKDGVDPELVLDILVKYAEGLVGSRLDSIRPMDEIILEFTRCLNMLKSNLYKEEFLT
jgi:AcrR family transcriptional regulator